MPTLHPLVDNYAPRKYKALRSSKLKALGINQRENSGTRGRWLFQFPDTIVRFSTELVSF